MKISRKNVKKASTCHVERAVWISCLDAVVSDRCVLYGKEHEEYVH